MNDHDDYGHHEIKIFNSKGGIDMVLDRISAEERSTKEFIGKGYSSSLLHVVSMGMRYGEGVERARWYYISEEVDEKLEDMRKTHPDTVCIELYADQHLVN
jgi:hypothetical protein